MHLFAPFFIFICCTNVNNIIFVKPKIKIEEKFAHFGDNAIMHALLGSILFDNPTGCALLGQRNESQAAAAGELSVLLTKEEAAWVFSLYRN